MLDSDLARLYGVATMRLNEQVARNRARFPEDFAYQLTQQEFYVFDIAKYDIKGRPRQRRLAPSVCRPAAGLQRPAEAARGGADPLLGGVGGGHRRRARREVVDN